MKKEYIIEVQMKSGGFRIFREWGYSAGDAFQNLKKNQGVEGSMKSARLA